MPTKQGKLISKLLKDSNKPYKFGAEIGVWRGSFTFKILDELPDIKKYHCVDMWKHYPDHTDILNPKGKMARANMDEVYNTFKEKAKPFGKKLIIHRMSSVKASKLIPDGSLDFIFIDANHAYKYAKQDIRLWTPKVKRGGLVSGHDYKNPRFEVTKAVNESFSSVFELSNKIWYTWKK